MKKSDIKTAFFIARRYLFSRKKHNIINIISIISTIGITVSTAALIIVLSVFNGMDGLVKESFNSFNPDLKITAMYGKSFASDTFPIQEISAIKGVKAVHEVVSDLSLITYQNKQVLVTLKGVDQSYIATNNMQHLLIDGTFELGSDPLYYGIPGAVSAGLLQINLNSPEMMHIYYPKRGRKNFVNSADAFNKRYLLPVGVFASNTKYDEDHVFCNIAFARELMDYEGRVTSIEVVLTNEKELASCQKAIEKIVGDQYLVQNRYQQEELLFKTIKTEKLIIFFILSFILLVAAFNIIGSLGMLIVEKKDDVQVLNSLGASSKLIRNIFMLEGMLISFFGGLIGMFAGALICFLQETFHIIKLGNGEGSYIIDHYPVAMQASDFAIVLCTIIVISLFASWIPTKILKKR